MGNTTSSTLCALPQITKEPTIGFHGFLIPASGYGFKSLGHVLVLVGVAEHVVGKLRAAHKLGVGAGAKDTLVEHTLDRRDVLGGDGPLGNEVVDRPAHVLGRKSGTLFQNPVTLFVYNRNNGKHTTVNGVQLCRCLDVGVAQNFRYLRLVAIGLFSEPEVLGCNVTTQRRFLIFVEEFVLSGLTVDLVVDETGVTIKVLVRSFEPLDEGLTLFLRGILTHHAELLELLVEPLLDSGFDFLVVCSVLEMLLADVSGKRFQLVDGIGFGRRFRPLFKSLDRCRHSGSSCVVLLK